MAARDFRSSQRVPFLDLRIVDPHEARDLGQALNEHLSSGRFLISDEGDPFETDLKKMIGRRYCVGVNTGTDALSIGLQVLDITPNKHVLTTPFSWLASSTSIRINKLRPWFVDVTDDLQIDLNMVEQCLSEHRNEIGAVLVPHLHGNVSLQIDLTHLINKYNVPLVEDCAQSFGASDANGRVSGSAGTIAAFSFNPMKVLGSLGDAGALLFDNSEYFERSKRLRHSGVLGATGLAEELARNCRIDALHCSFLRVKLKYYNAKIVKRREIYNYYINALPPQVRPITNYPEGSNFYVMQTICEDRDGLMNYLATKGVETRVRHEPLISAHPIFASDSRPTPNALRLSKASLCLPMHENLTSDQVEHVCQSTLDFYCA